MFLYNFVKKQQGVLLKSVLTVFDNHMMLLRILAKFQKNTVKKLFLCKFSGVQSATLLNTGSFTSVFQDVTEIIRTLIMSNTSFWLLPRVYKI